MWQDQANALQLHLVDNSSCIVPDWESRKVITSTDWFKEYKREIEDYEKFIDKCSVEQREACESVLKFGSGLLAIGVAGSGNGLSNKSWFAVVLASRCRVPQHMASSIFVSNDGNVDRHHHFHSRGR